MIYKCKEKRFINLVKNDILYEKAIFLFMINYLHYTPALQNSFKHNQMFVEIKLAWLPKELLPSLWSLPSHLKRISISRPETKKRFFRKLESQDWKKLEFLVNFSENSEKLFFGILWLQYSYVPVAGWINIFFFHKIKYF